MGPEFSSAGGWGLGDTKTKIKVGVVVEKKRESYVETGVVERTPLRTSLKLEPRAGLHGEERAAPFCNVCCCSQSIACSCDRPFICQANVWIP